MCTARRNRAATERTRYLCDLSLQNESPKPNYKLFLIFRFFLVRRPRLGTNYENWIYLLFLITIRRMSFGPLLVQRKGEGSVADVNIENATRITGIRCIRRSFP